MCLYFCILCFVKFLCIIYVLLWYNASVKVDKGVCKMKKALIIYMLFSTLVFVFACKKTDTPAPASVPAQKTNDQAEESNSSIEVNSTCINGTIETRTMYKKDATPCKSEKQTRTCKNKEWNNDWTGSYTESSCAAANEIITQFFFN